MTEIDPPSQPPGAAGDEPGPQETDGAPAAAETGHPDPGEGRPAIEVRKRAGRQVLMLVAAVLLAVAAFDIVSGHRLATPPERDEESGVVTPRGLSQQRTDYLWGAVLMLAAAGVGIAAASGLVRRAPVAVISDDAIRLRVWGPSEYLTLPWEHVLRVRSGSDGGDEVVPTRVLLVDVDDPEPYPQRLWGAEWHGSTLQVDADTWASPPEDVATRAQLALEGWQRDAARAVADDPPAAAVFDP